MRKLLCPSCSEPSFSAMKLALLDGFVVFRCKACGVSVRTIEKDKHSWLGLLSLIPTYYLFSRHDYVGFALIALVLLTLMSYIEYRSVEIEFLRNNPEKES